MIFIPFMVSAQVAGLREDSITSQALNEVTVKASRLEIKKRFLPQKLEVITSRDIDLNPSADVGDIVKKLAAIDVIQRPGIATYPSIRGFRPPVEPGRINPEVSVLINGRPSGTQNLALFDPNSIARIEILKGAAGAIYGSSTMGGLINIVTKQSKGKVRGQVYGGHSSFQTTDMGFSLGGNVTEKLDFNFSGSFFDRNKALKLGKGNIFRKLLGSDEVEFFLADGSITTEKDTLFDGRRRNGTRMGYYAGTLRMGYQINNNWRVEASGNSFMGRGIESAGDLRLIDAAPGHSNRFFSNGDLAVKGKIKNHALSLTGFITDEENSTFNAYNGSTFNLLTLVPSPTYQRSQGVVGWKGFQFQDLVAIHPDIRFIGGVDYSQATSQTRAWEQANAKGNFAVTERSPYSPYSYVNTYAPFAQAYISTLKEKLIINPSVRYDFIHFGITQTPLFLNLTPRKENNAFFSPNLGLQYNVNDKLSAHGNVGRAFRFAQSFEIAGYIETYFPGNKVRISTGNADLKNEQSVTWDAGFKYSDVQKGLSLGMTYFNTSVENRVRQVAVPEKAGQIHTDGKTIDQYLTYTNADEASIHGLEINGSYDLGAKMDSPYALRVFANATHLIAAEDITKGDGSKPDSKVRIRNVAPLNMSYGIEYDSRKAWLVRLSSRYVSKRYAQDFGNLDPKFRGAFFEMPRYMTMDLVVNYSVNTQNMLSCRINNLTDENYYESRGYNLGGRSIGLRYTYSF